MDVEDDRKHSDRDEYDKKHIEMKMVGIKGGRMTMNHSPVRTAHGQPLLNLLRFSLLAHPYTTLRKGGRQGEDNVTDMTTVMSRFELFTSCI